MAFDLIQAVQEKMGFGSFDKINPNEQQGKQELQQSASSDHYAQAATVAVLLGLYKYGETKEGAEQLFNVQGEFNLNKIFFTNENQAIEAVSKYGNMQFNDTRTFMQKIANVAIECLRVQTGNDASMETVQSLIGTQRHNILIFLPPDLDMGKILNDKNLDDRTNKMEGPVSNLMHKIENLFSEGDNKTQG